MTPTFRNRAAGLLAAPVLAASLAACSTAGGPDLSSALDLSLPQTVAATPYSFAAGAAGAEAAEGAAPAAFAAPADAADADSAALPPAPASGATAAEIAAAGAVAVAYADPGASSAGGRALADVPNGRADAAVVDRLISKYAALYDVPEGLVRRVVRRESTFNPSAYSKGHWGLMQIKHATARGMGYDGPAKGLLDPETNLKYAVKYLRGAYLVAGGDERRADRLYQRGYYYDAKRAGLLDETGLGRDRTRKRRL